ncbi:MAG: prephenate dehydrogenase/arogenate dehydrogenase family protein [Anaerolineales bacterium]
MAIQVTLIGLGQVGASIGMALAEQKDKIYRVGHDKEFNVEREAQKKNAIDKAEHNLPRAVEDSRLVVLSLPASQVRDTLEFIAQDLQDGTVILDMSPFKVGVAEWAKELLPEGCYYVGIVPTVGPTFLNIDGKGLESAKADLFAKSIFFVAAPQGTPGEAVELASNFVSLIGATPMLADIHEVDGFLSAAHLLPQLASVALLNATLDQPGWNDARKIAGRVYAATTTAIEFDDSASLQVTSLQNRTNITYALDVYIAALRGLRDDIANGDTESLAERLKSAQTGRDRWLGEHFTASWDDTRQPAPSEYPSLSERLFGALTGKRANKKK